MEFSPDQVLVRILRSRTLQGMDAHKELLQYICHATQAGEFPLEHDTGVVLFAMEPGYDVNAEPIVSRTATELRDKLKEYFANEGRAERLRLAIPKGELRAFFYEADPELIAQAEAEPTAMQRFWEPYWTTTEECLLLHGQTSDSEMLIPEAYIAVQIALLFEKNSAPVTLHPARAFENGHWGNRHLILTGTPQTNPLLARFTKEELQGPVVQRIRQNEDHGVITILASSEPATLNDAVLAVMNEELLANTVVQFDNRKFPPFFTMHLNRR